MDFTTLTKDEKIELLETDWWMAGYYYSPIVNKLKEMGFERIYDIGCGYGMHFDVVTQSGIKYIGYDMCEDFRLMPFFQALEWEFPEVELHFNKKYPFEITPDEKSVAVSICAIGGKYPNSNLKEETQQVAKNFKHFFVSTFDEAIDVIKDYWTYSEKISDDVFHFWND